MSPREARITEVCIYGKDEDVSIRIQVGIKGENGDAGEEGVL